MAQIAMVAEEETAAASRAKGISVDSDQAGIFVLADGQRLEQVLVNLLSNAIRFSPEGGKIRISASQRDGFAEVCVEDEGTGIPVDQLNTIFDRYKQVGDNREVREGSGLGLTICKALVELHGGRIWAEIGDQKGSRFKFTVPLAT
jgi:histidine kinase